MTFFTDVGYVNSNEGNHPLTFVGKNIIDNKLISDIEKYIDQQELEDAKILHTDRELADSGKIRSGKIHWMKDESYKHFLMPIYQDICSKVRQINDGMWRYNYDGYNPFQYSEYIVGDHFDWHIDQIDIRGHSRKVSFSLGVSDKSEYEGGDLVFKTGDEDHYKLGRGDLIVFPSWMLHKVTPITKGKRRVIVGWGEGLIL
tara:strand:+ start:249 stop:851 length:603 start_codon:yes stop_codon:yes gene_type:complete